MYKYGSVKYKTVHMYRLVIKQSFKNSYIIVTQPLTLLSLYLLKMRCPFMES